MVKKPKVFQNKIDKVIKNNKTVFDSSKEEVLEIVKEDVNKDIYLLFIYFINFNV